MSKLITFAVPCYNSAAYMDHCVRTLLTGGDDIEIILVDDGSTKDDTPAICDRYQAEYPDIVRAIHQENGGHGGGVNQGLRHAQGMYYKVVDSDDWLDEAALKAVLDKLRAFAGAEQPLDLFIANYVYEHVEDNTQKVMKYTNVFPEGRVFTWNEIGRFRPSQYLLMHSVIYRTEMLRACRLELPKHTFYVDNIFVYQPHLLHGCGSLPLLHWPCRPERERKGDGHPGRPAGAGHQADDRQPQPQAALSNPAQAGPVYDQLPVHDDDHLLHLPHHRRLSRRPG